MTLEALLKQPKTHETIQLIESFLNTSSNESEHTQAKFFYASLLTHLGQYELSNQLCETLLEELKHKEDDDLYVEVLFVMSENYIELKDYSEAKKRIEQRRRALPILKQYMYYMDLIRLAKAENEPYDQFVNKALEDAIPEQIRQTLQLDKLDGYVNSGAYDLAMDMIKQLRMRQLSPETAQKLQLIELDILTKSNHYEAILTITQNQHHPRLYKYHLSALIGLKKTHQVSIFEVEHEKEFETLSVEDQKAIYTCLVDFYDKEIDTLSAETYSKKLKQLKKIESSLSKPIERTEVEIPIEPVIKKDIMIEKTDIPLVEKRYIDRSKDFEAIHTLLKTGLTLPETVSGREQARFLLEQALDQKPFSTVLIYLNGTLKMYRKGRLYDKMIEKEDLLKSVFHAAFLKQEDIIEETDIIRWNYDVITRKPYDIETVKRVYTYAIKNGALSYYQTDDSTPTIYDDYLKLLTTLIEKTFTQEDKHATVSQKLEFYQTILDSNLIALKIETEDGVHLNLKASNLLELKQNLSSAEYTSSIKGEDQIKYQQFKQKLTTSPTPSVIRYEIRNKMFEEQVIKFNSIKDYAIVSILTDVTNTLIEHELLSQQAKIDGITGHLNTYAFSIDFEDYIDKKSTFVLIQLHGVDAIESLYGKMKTDAFFKEFADYSLKQLENSVVYTLDNHQVLMVLPYNDVRTVEKALQNYFKALKENTSVILAKQPFLAHAGVIRYPVNTTETKLEKVMRFLQLSLEKAKRRYSHVPFQYFDFQDYQEEQFEVSIIEQMDDAITQEQLKLVFSPIIHLQTNKVFLYQVNPILDTLSVDPNYYYLIAKRRLQIDKLDKYVLKTAFHFLSQLAVKTDKYIRLSISIDEDTFRQKDFNAYVIGLIKQYDLPYSVIELSIKSTSLSGVEWLKTQELADLGIHIGASEWFYSTMPSVHFIHRREPIKLDQLKTLDFILSFKDYLQNHQMGLILESIEDIDKKKLKDYPAIYVKESKMTYSEEKLIQMIEGAK